MPTDATRSRADRSRRPRPGRARLVLVALVALTLVGSGAWAPTAAGRQPDDDGTLAGFDHIVDAVRFRGRTYVTSAEFADFGPPRASPNGVDLGPQIGTTVAVPYRDGLLTGPRGMCRKQLPEGGAPLLADGTALYAVNGYATGFRIAASGDQGTVLYQALCGEAAFVGADLYDVYGRVARITLVDRGPARAIADPATIDGVVAELLAARVLTLEEVGWEGEYAPQMVLDLEDGSYIIAYLMPDVVRVGGGGLNVADDFAARVEAAARARDRAA